MVALVGRDRPAAVLQAEIKRTVNSHGGLVFVTGEAGIGKTVLVADAVEAAKRQGALVAGGTCWDREGAPGYWPWVQVLRGLQRAMTPEVWSAARAAAGGELASLLGEVSTQRRLGPAGDESFGLQDAVTTLLVTASRSHPVVVVLDDLHWADPSSIRLLEFVARHAWFEQLLVVGTYRDVEVEAADHPLAPLLPPLVAKATSVTLTGLDRDEVGVLLARTAGRTPSDEMVAEVHRKTGGNPFFVDQTAHLWHSSNSVDAIAPGVRDAVERRLRLLPDPVRELLTAASVLGPEFDRDVLAVSTELPAREMDRLVGDAVSARLIVPNDNHSRLAFVHDLVRETMYTCMGDAEARQRHAAVVQAFERSPELGNQAGPAEIAHHAYLAVPDVTPVDAVGLLRAAARDAWSRMAADEAAGHLRRALELVSQDRTRDWAAVALDLASFQNHLGESTACRQTFEDAADIARKLDDHELLTRVALRLRSEVWLAPSGDLAPLATRLVNEAHAKLIGDDERTDDHSHPSAQRTDLQREQELSARAVELARESGDDEALMTSLCGRSDAIWMPGTARERELIADEIGEVARRRSDPSSALFAVMMKTMALLEQGDPRCLDEQAAFVATAEDMNSVLSHWTKRWSQATFAAFTGRFDEARAYLDETDAIESQVHNESPSDDVTVLRLQQRWTVELLQGRFDAADTLVHSARHTSHPYPELLAALTAMQKGDVDVALRYYHSRAASASAEERPAQWFEPLWLRFQAQVAAGSGDPQLCEAARAKIEPTIGQWAVMFGDVPHGPMVLWSAVIDAAQERWDEAIAGFTAAHRAADRLGARPWSIEARSRLADALLRREASGDAEEAEKLLEAVEQEATEIGMLHVSQRARQARMEQTGTDRSVWRPGSSEPDVTAAASEEARAEPEETAAKVFRLDGQVWTLTYDSRTVHIPDAKGLRDIHVLLSQTGADVRAVDLFAPEAGDLAMATRRLGADPVLDEKAKTAYRNRLTQLDEQIDRALDRQNDERAVSLDRERSALIDEIRRATGLGGRPRRLGDGAERARKAVSERIRDTLRRLDQTHPPLAEHLRASISTGASCRYQPSDDIAWML